MTTQELNYIYQEWLNIYSFPQEVNRVQFLALAKSGGNPYELDDRQIKFVEFWSYRTSTVYRPKLRALSNHCL